MSAPQASARRAGPGRPAVALVPLAIAALAFVALPVVALLARAPWSDLISDLTSHAALEALRLSLVTSVSAAVAATILGVPLAVLLTRGVFRGRSALHALVLLPMVLPPVVGGVALLLAFGREGLVGGFLEDSVGLRLPFTTAGVVVAQTFVALPFVVVTVGAALRTMDRRPEEAAATLGAGPWTVLRRVTLPAVAPAILAGAALAWARALGEFGATITFAGSLPGETRTLPLALFNELQTSLDGAVSLAVLMLAVSVGVLIGLRGRWLAR